MCKKSLPHCRGSSVIADFLERDGADDFAHIALERIRDGAAEIRFSHIQKVLHGELDAFRVRLDSDLGNRVHIDADEVVGRDIAFRLDVDGDLPDNELIYTLQKRNSDTRSPNQNAGPFSYTGNDVATSGGAFT